MQLKRWAAVAVISLAACNGPSAGKNGIEEPAGAMSDITAGECAAKAAGTEIAAASMPLQDGVLANASFSVRLIATNKPGTYTVKAQYGEATGESELNMPQGAESLCPLLQGIKGETGFMVGFRLNGDKAFKEYYKITAQHGSMEMRYVKHYSFR